MSKRSQPIPRPLRKNEYELHVGTSQAEKGWRDLRATQLNAVVETWEFLTRTPTERREDNYPLRDDLATVVRSGMTHEQWQHKLSGGARIWFYVEGKTVVLTQVSTAHPNQTK